MFGFKSWSQKGYGKKIRGGRISATMRRARLEWQEIIKSKIKSFKAATGNAGFPTLRFASVKRTLWSSMWNLPKPHARPWAVACIRSSCHICGNYMIFMQTNTKSHWRTLTSTK